MATRRCEWQYRNPQNRYDDGHTSDEKRNKPEKRVVRWVSGISYVEGAGIVKLRFAPEVVPLITKLEKNFTSYELEQVKSLNLYATRLYELLICWRSVGRTPVIDIEEFRGQLGIGADEYQTMSNFKNRVLTPAIEQVSEHTDITVSYDQQKSGRIITGFVFTLKIKKSPQDITPKTKKKTDIKETPSNGVETTKLALSTEAFFQRKIRIRTTGKGNPCLAKRKNRTGRKNEQRRYRL